MKKLIIALIASIFAPFAINAATIKGFVFDKKTNEPIIGAIITTSNQNNGVQTDFNGRFILRNVPTGTDQIHVKSLGYSDFNQTIIIVDDKAEIDLGRINMKTAKSKHYNRVTVAFNPVVIPALDSPSDDWINYNKLNRIGISLSYLHGYNFINRFSAELGAKYNYCFVSVKRNNLHSQSKHHSISIFTNLAYDIPVKNVTISPYIGLYMRKYLYSKVSQGDEQECTVYDTELHFNNKWLNPGAQVGIGFKFKKFYIGGEMNCYFDQDQRNCSLSGYYHNDHDPESIDHFLEYSVTLGYEF